MKLKNFPKTYKLLQEYLHLTFGNADIACPYWINKLSRRQILIFLRQNRIGVDCSGFVYNLANYLDKEKGGEGLARKLFNKKIFPRWNPAWRTSVQILTSNAKTREIKLSDIRVGDLIRLTSGRHVLFVIDVTGKYITYAHSSKFLTKKSGVHLGKIKVTDRLKGLEDQLWLEKTPKGESFGKKYFDPSQGDSLRRFNWW